MAADADAEMERRVAVHLEKLRADLALLTMKQARARVGVSQRTMAEWVKSRKVRVIRTAGGSPRIVAGSLYRHEKAR